MGPISRIVSTIIQIAILKFKIRIIKKKTRYRYNIAQFYTFAQVDIIWQKTIVLFVELYFYFLFFFISFLDHANNPETKTKTTDYNCLLWVNLNAKTKRKNPGF